MLSYLYNKQVTHSYALSCSEVACIIKKGFFNILRLVIYFTVNVEKAEENDYSELHQTLYTAIIANQQGSRF